MFFIQFILQAFVGWMYGLATMVHFHNLIVSMFLYKARQTNVSNIFKILFNFGGLTIYICEVWFLIVPTDVTLNECKAASYTLMFGHIIHKSALSAFLLWRLRQIENKSLDFWLGTALFFCRFCFHFAQLPLIKPYSQFDSVEDAAYCVTGVEVARTALLGAISFDLAIDLYVTIRLVQILNRANKNATQISSNITRKTKRSLFTAVIYWNFLRLFLATCYNTVILYYSVFGIYREFNLEITTYTNAALVFLVILLSYSITADAEIVRVIEGKKDDKGFSSNSAGTGKSYNKNMPQTPKSPSSHYQTSSEPPKYSTGNYIYSENEKPESDNIGDNKIAVVSMKRLSFFEWANVVVGNKHGKKNNDIVDEESGIENGEESGIEIVEESPEVAGSYSRSNNQNRDSSFSGTTTITTTTTSSTMDDDVV